MSNQSLPQNWDFFMCRVEGAPASIRTNLALYNIAPLDGLLQRLQFCVKMQNPTPEGFPSEEEYPILCNIEDAIGDKAEATGAVLAGVVKSEGVLELWFYTANAEALAHTCQEALKDFSDYPFQYFTADDPHWDDYFEFLYPDAYSYQVMQNRKVLMQLEKNGDKMEVARPIDHFIYFKDETQQQGFAQKVTAEGYTVRLSDEKTANERKAQGGTFVYTVEATRKDSPNEINRIVWELIELATPFEGEYDGWGCVNVTNN